MKGKIVAALVLMSLSRGAFAQTSGQAVESLKPQLEQLQRAVEELKKTVQAQQKRIVELEASKMPSVARTTSNILPSPQSGNAGTTSAQVPALYPRPSGNHVPDIGVVADIVGTSTQSGEDSGGNDRFSLRELEFVFGHDVDPYTRLDAVVTFSDQEDPAIEEAYVTYFGLPLGIKAKIGQMRQRIGKASASHRDALDTVDEPFVVQRYFGPEGLFRSGVELSTFTPLSLEDYTQELVLGVMEGGTNEGDLFAGARRHPTLYAHLPNFWQLSDLSSVELGGTYLLGSKEEDSHFDMSAFGIDLAFIHSLSPIKKLKLQSELYLQKRDATDFANVNGTLTKFNANPFGFYTLIDYRLSERWGIGTRYDFVEPTREQEGWRGSETGYAGYVTFFQSEFSRWRLEYQRATLLGGGNDNRFFLQGTFAIGSHKHSLN